MEEMLSRPPRTIMEVYQMLPEGTLAELIDGSIYMSPAPLVPHQKLIGDLFFEISGWVRKNPNLGEVFLSPIDVYLDTIKNAVQPDIVFVAQKNLGIVQRKGIFGVPDLLIEIISPGNPSHDRVTKKDLYQKFGVKEYWIVDPDTRESVGFELVNDAFKEFHRSVGNIQSKLLEQTFKY